MLESCSYIFFPLNKYREGPQSSGLSTPESFIMLKTFFLSIRKGCTKLQELIHKYTSIITEEQIKSLKPYLQGLGDDNIYYSCSCNLTCTHDWRIWTSSDEAIAGPRIAGPQIAASKKVLKFQN